MTMLTSVQQPQHEAEESGLEHGDIVQDVQFFQDAAVEYQMSYQSLKDKYSHQAVLVKEASEALKASESERLGPTPMISGLYTTGGYRCRLL